MSSKNSTMGVENFLRFLAPAFILAGFFIFVGVVKAESMIITQDTIWHDGQVIIVDDYNNGLTVEPGAKLIVEAGVIIKMGDYNNINVYGDLELQGTADKSVIITSLKETQLEPGIWGKIKTYGLNAKINIDYAKIEYGGGSFVAPCLAGLSSEESSAANQITITHSNLINNYQLFNIGASDVLKINYSNIYNKYNPGYCYQTGNGADCGAQIENYGDTIYDLANNYWGNPFGPTKIIAGEDWNKPLLGTYIFGQADYLPFLTSPWTPAPPKPKLNPVILIPGFFGSWDVGGKLALDPILHTYDNLWEALKLAGYEENKSLFAFPYNWRQSNATSSLLLKQKITDVKAACNSAKLDGYDCDKVDLVAHSMGGLVARAYIESDNYQNDVNQLIFLATPQQGAPMAYLAWEGGEAGTQMKDSVMWNIMFSEAKSKGYFTNFSYFRGLPMLSLKELLPTFNYLKDNGSDNLRSYPDNYPQNDFLENLNNPLNLAKLNNVKILNIVADNNIGDTMYTFRVVPKNSSVGMWEYGYPENYWVPFSDHGIEKGNGDNTVPAISNKDFNNFDQNIFYGSDHLTVVTYAQSDVIKKLTGISPSQEVKNNFIKNYFMVRIFSPADFVIIAPDGKKLGKDFFNNQNINEIAGAYYSGKFATIPNPLDGEYKIELQGTGNGEYKLSVSGISEATSTDKDFIGQITTGAIQDFKLDYSSSSPDLLADLQPQDIIPPSLIVNYPIGGKSYNHGDKIIINYQASDDFSGLAATEIKIDNELISSTTVNLFDYKNGSHTLSIVVHDQSGNSTEKKVNFNLTADIKSTITDIGEIYKRGWLKSLCRKTVLISELKILDSALSLFDKAKNEIIKKTEEIKNNSKLSAKAKEKLIVSLNKELTELDRNQQKIINLNLGIFEKTLNEAKKSNYLNQVGYDIIKGDLEYLKINL